MQEVYRNCLLGSLLSSAFLVELSRAVKGFLTPGQTADAAHVCLHVLRDAWTAFFAESESEAISFNDMADLLNGSGSGRQRWRNIDDLSLNSANIAALSYSLGGRLVATVLPSLPFSTLSASVHSSIRSDISELYSVFAEKATTIVSSSDSSWTEQIIAAVTLRIGHALTMCPYLHSIDALSSHTALGSRISAMANSLQTVPELMVEMVLALFSAYFGLDP